ncbi:MAG: hypothetical protein VX246_16695, partial [Myxococcota bacterium]|nr:hypothetical protein [Myxococcota bacterium]
MIHYANPPLLLENVIEDPADVVRLLERHAPYTPLGGWYRPDVDPDERSSPMWFQNDWVHADLELEGSELFLRHERVMQAARDFYSAEVISPHSVYVNVMAALDRAGPAHTDNPRFHGRDRSNTPMWLLRTMLWSGLFDQWSIVQATSIWWLNDVEGGALRYWPDGPDKPPKEHHGAMANTALVGDNHGMFHQVEPVGPFEAGTPLVTGRAELAPEEANGSGDWAVTDRGEVCYRAPLEHFRVSVLWKAHIYENEDERRTLEASPLSLEDVARIFAEDLSAKGSDLRLDLDRLDDP